MRSLVGLALTVLLVAMPGDDNAAAARRGAGPHPAEDTATLVFTGDTLIHLGVSAAARRNGRPYDFTPMFDGVRHLISRADLAICHLEVPLDPESVGMSGYPLFNAPAEVAPALAEAGYDGCSVASNHSFDRGVAGIHGTLDVLEDSGVAAAGMFRSADEAGRAVLFELDGLTVGFVSGTYWLNGLRLPADQQWLVQLLEPAEMIHAAAQARLRGADLVIAAMHCCTEYRQAPTERQRQIAHDLAGSRFIDMVVTHHSHVVGPVEELDGDFIFHGLGNFISGQVRPVTTQDGVIAVAHAVRRDGEWRIEEVEVVPTRVLRGTYRVVPAEPGGPSYERTMSAVESMGLDVGLYLVPGLSPAQLAMIE